MRADRASPMAPGETGAKILSCERGRRRHPALRATGWQGPGEAFVRATPLMRPATAVRCIRFARAGCCGGWRGTGRGPCCRRRTGGETLFWALAPLVLLDLLSMALGGPPVLVCVGFLVALQGSRPIADALLRRTLERQPCREQLAGRARGEVVRVHGRVRPGPSFASAGGRWPSVLAAYAGSAMHPAGRSSAGKSGGKRGRRRRRDPALGGDPGHGFPGGPAGRRDRGGQRP